MRQRARIAILLALGLVGPLAASRALVRAQAPEEASDAGAVVAAEPAPREEPSADADAGMTAPGAGEPAVAADDEAEPDEASTPEPDPAPDGATLPPEHQPEITVRLTPESGIATGDVVHLELTVEVPEGDDVNLPRQSYAPFELVGQDHVESVQGGRRRFVITLDLLALEPGDLEIPALSVRVITADGVVGTARTEPRTVHVESLLANEPDAQPRPPTAPVVVMQDDYTLAYVLGALGLMALTALVTWLVSRWWRRRPKELPPPPPPRPPAEVALEKLRAMRRGLTAAIADGTQARVVDGASDALREYLGHRFDFNGLESTTDEVIARLRHQRMNVPLAEVTTLLGDCDLVKFAKMVPDEQDCERVIGDAERIVQRTMHANVTAIAPHAPPMAASPQGVKRAAAPVPPPPPPPPPESASGSGSGSVSGSDSVPGSGSDSVSASASAAVPDSVPDSASDPVSASAPVPAPVPATDPRRDLASIPLTNPPPPPDAPTLVSPPSFAIPVTPVPPPPPRDSEELEAVQVRETEDEVWARLDDAVAEDRLVRGEVLARREEGFLVALGAGVHGVLPEAQLSAALDADALVGQERAFRVVSLNAGRRRVVLSHRDVDSAAERALVGRSTPVGFGDPSSGGPSSGGPSGSGPSGGGAT